VDFYLDPTAVDAQTSDRLRIMLSDALAALGKRSLEK
jgi:hypothetical protein